jgi:hypothetical protein
MECEQVRQRISDGDGRVLRGRLMRAHLRDCAACQQFAAAIPGRQAELRAFTPVLAPAAAAALLSRAVGAVPGHAGTAASSAAASSTAAATAGKAAVAVVALKTVATGAVVVAAVAAGVTGLTHILRHHQPARPAALPSRPAAVPSRPAGRGGAAVQAGRTASSTPPHTVKALTAGRAHTGSHARGKSAGHATGSRGRGARASAVHGRSGSNVSATHGRSANRPVTPPSSRAKAGSKRATRSAQKPVVAPPARSQPPSHHRAPGPKASHRPVGSRSSTSSAKAQTGVGKSKK